MTKVHKQNSDDTGLRYCKEATLGVLPATADQVWYPAEPNTYSDFGGQIKTVARLPINASRQNQKGVTVDLDAAAGFNQDFTKTNMLRLLEGFMFAALREQYDSQSYGNETSVVSSAVTSDDTYRLAYGDDLSKVLANHLLFATGFSSPANNGVFVVNSATAGKAAQTLTSVANYADAETVTIGGKVYTFESSLTNVDGHVHVGASEAASILNLMHAINAAGGTPGTDYAAATTANPSVIASTGSHTVIATAIRNGRAGNSIATTETCANASWGAATLAGGIADIDVATNLTDETPPADARVQVVGYEFAASTVNVDVSNTLPRIVRASGAVDFTTFNLVPGQFIFVGGDDAGTKFVNVVNNGWARVHSVAAAYIELDKTTSEMVAETGTGLTIELFFGKVLKNESDPSLIAQSSFTLERDLGRADTAISGHQGEYLEGSVPNQLTVTVKQASKLEVDLTFVAINHTTVDQNTGLLSTAAANGGGSAPAIVSEDAFNTSDHFSRLRMTILDPTDAAPSPLFAYLTEFTLVVNNTVTPNKAVSVLGAFDVSTGQFEVSGKTTAYFADVAAIDAVRNNVDVTFDFAAVRDNAGIVFDVPLLALGDGRLNVQLNNPITLPLDMAAGADRIFNHTLLFGYYPYLPNAA